jgi:membrane protease YdiL (CAAX protease family)
LSHAPPSSDSPCSREVFFSGYAQSRLNEAFGRPWRTLGVAFGPSLLITAFVFGLVHLLNPFDYFRWQGRLALWWGCSAAASPAAKRAMPSAA